MSVANNVAFLRRVEHRLHAAKVRGARFEAESLVRHYGRMDRLDLFTGRKALTPGAMLAVERALRARLRGKPLQYVLGEADFGGLTFYVSPSALIPRPETELLVEEADRLLAERGAKRPSVLDLGTGSGCIAVCLTLKRPECRMTALDVSDKALGVARKNIERHGLRKKIRLVRGDLFRPFGRRTALWDVIVSNPPYIPRTELPALSREVRAEPRVALDGGDRGLDVILRILAEAPARLKSSGSLLMEIGKGQSKALVRLAAAQGAWKPARFVKDLAGIERVLVLQKG